MMNTATAMRFLSASISDRGLSEKRPVNEDSYLELVERGLFAVADGVGGAQAGDVASQMAMEVLFEAFSNPQPGVDTEELMEMAIQRANQSIHQMAHELPSLDMMATTIVTLHLGDGVATIGHVGDSRLYRLDTRGNLFRETQDHSVVEEEVRAGRMTVSQAANHPSRNVISRALGAEDTVEVDMKTIRFEPGTTFLLCSDGVTRHVQDPEIREILLGKRSPNDVCNEIKNLCYGRGAEDNLTAVVVKIAAGSENTTLEDEPTIPGIRPALLNPDFAPAANGTSRARGEAPTDELPPLAHDEFDTQTFESPATLRFPAATSDFDDTIADDSSQQNVPSSDVTLQHKLDNERLRDKINNAAPPQTFESIEQPKNESATGRLLTWLLLLLVGAAIGAGLIYALMRSQSQPNETPTSTAPQTSQNQTQQPSTLADSGLSASEVIEFRTFERLRRTVDNNPSTAPNAAAPVSAADFYLRGRAFLQTGNYEGALEALKTAQEMLPDTRDVDRETLRVDIAFAMAAVGAMANNANSKKVLGEIVGEKKQTAKSQTTSTP
jgi:protein phosphatase